ncbi:GntR family transcriptional regulator [Fertoebacter nigrum]|uniref:GntR family transcriptional regulator n=1 Tax=Fertoeibacter niger TaxID=2656921 RepID=A0A8X8H230_9RHOB|nr:GntR family transcriptional regulator [Fertoeibacter niger]NUB45655.1 GntR family transcriptional regulator [Fertoeibacter niger]
MAGQVAEELRRRILSGDYAEGEQLLQEQLAQEFGVSKVPVREALHLLEAEGLISQQFHRGAVVTGISPRDLMELFELRAQIEGWLLGLAMPRATEADIGAASARNAQLRATTDAVVGWDLNWRFHEMLYVPAGKPYILDHLRQLHTRTARYVREVYDTATSRQQVTEEHEAILHAYARQDPGTASLVSDHILRGARKLTDRLSEIQLQPTAP